MHFILALILAPDRCEFVVWSLEMCVRWVSLCQRQSPRAVKPQMIPKAQNPPTQLKKMITLRYLLIFGGMAMMSDRCEDISE